MSDDLLSAIDAWITEARDDPSNPVPMSRPEAVRRLTAAALRRRGSKG